MDKVLPDQRDLRSKQADGEHSDLGSRVLHFRRDDGPARNLCTHIYLRERVAAQGHSERDGVWEDICPRSGARTCLKRVKAHLVNMDVWVVPQDGSDWRE